MSLPKKLQDMQESNDQRAEQKRWVSEMVNLSGIVPCAKGQISMQNNQLSHTRCDRDQLFRNCFSNPFQRPRQARSAKWKYCAQCFWLERKSDCVQNKWKTKKEVPRINLLMTTCEDSWHFSLVKSISALLYDQTRHGGRKHFCHRCLSSITTKGILQKHEEACKGINRRKGSEKNWEKLFP